MEQESLVDQKLVRSLQLEIAKLQVDLNSKKDELEEAISTQVSKKFRLFVLCVLQRYVSIFFSIYLKCRIATIRFTIRNFRLVIFMRLSKLIILLIDKEA